MTFAEVHVKRSVILTDRLGPDILLVLTMPKNAVTTFTNLNSIATLNFPTFPRKSGRRLKILVNATT